MELLQIKLKVIPLYEKTAESLALVVIVDCCICCAVGTGQASLFGNNQGKLGATMGTFGATAFNSGANTMGFGAPQQPVGERSRSVPNPSIVVVVV